jgi:hypothetical protein
MLAEKNRIKSINHIALVRIIEAFESWLGARFKDSSG